ncbi:MAG: 16S rRNA (guanine(527)-N(7))-methyltransferase RsmG [Burkholderiales bacterium]|nr:16S rRNA (guanine(527)-N(7))-methyltransferase RsmG [Burkholderiales bacterium]
MVGLDDMLARGAADLGVPLSPAALRKLLDYQALLAKWNRVYNLTAIREPERVVSHHLLDSLAVVPHLEGHRVADIGTGAGLPGIPIAILRPQWVLALVDSNHKKMAFVTQALAELQITNGVARRDRVEQWRPVDPFDQVVSRAFADLPDFVKVAGHLVRPGGQLVAMKGLHPYEEIAQLPADWVCIRVQPLEVPGVDGQRHLVFLQRASEVPGDSA